MSASSLLGGCVLRLYGQCLVAAYPRAALCAGVVKGSFWLELCNGCLRNLPGYATSCRVAAHADCFVVGISLPKEGKAALNRIKLRNGGTNVRVLRVEGRVTGSVGSVVGGTIKRCPGGAQVSVRWKVSVWVFARVCRKEVVEEFV